ncbi:MAG: hypothetical protein WCD75_00345 [Rhodoplanes sp.]
MHESEKLAALNRFWDSFLATTLAEVMLSLFSYPALNTQEKETPTLVV